MQHVPLGELFWEVEVRSQGAQQQCCQWGRWRCDPRSSLLPAPSLPPSATFQAEEQRSGTGPCARGAAGLLPAVLVCSSKPVERLALSMQRAAMEANVTSSAPSRGCSVANLQPDLF